MTGDIMAIWINNCIICNDGVQIRVEELKKEGHSELNACCVMEEEAHKAYPELKDDFTVEKIRNRYRYHMKGRWAGQNDQQKIKGKTEISTIAKKTETPTLKNAKPKWRRRTLPQIVLEQFEVNRQRVAHLR